MEDADIGVRYLSAGANRHTAVADWSQSGVLAFGADSNIALWKPGVSFCCFSQCFPCSFVTNRCLHV